MQWEVFLLLVWVLLALLCCIVERIMVVVEDIIERSSCCLVGGNLEPDRSSSMLNVPQPQNLGFSDPMYGCSSLSSFVPLRSKQKFYAVRKGVRPGIYYTWAECESLVKYFSDVQFKSFRTREEAQRYMT